MTFAPEGAFGDQGITRGVMIGLGQSSGGNLQQSTQDYVDGLVQSNSYLRQQSGFQRTIPRGTTGVFDYAFRPLADHWQH